MATLSLSPAIQKSWHLARQDDSSGMEAKFDNRGNSNQVSDAGSIKAQGKIQVPHALLTSPVEND